MAFLSLSQGATTPSDGSQGIQSSGRKEPVTVGSLCLWVAPSHTKRGREQEW